ncbi:MFS transporter [Deinococcus sp.]|uniref:MFS transporter n=1 Tax=Deinococcus sp. TaxID=47478 RepID=UPI003B5BA876
MTQPQSVAAPPVPRLLAPVAFGIFLLLGVLYPILGPALPRLSEKFGLQASGVAWLLSGNSAGAFAGVVLAGLLPPRFTFERRALLGIGLTLLACLGLAFAPDFPLALLAAVLVGLGFGILDLTTNIWLATRYGDKSAAALNLLSTGFGIGAVAAPLAVGYAGGSFQWPLLICAAFAALLLWPLLILQRQAGAVPVASTEPQEAPLAESIDAAPPPGRSRLILGVFVVLFMVYVAVESGVGSWEVTDLQGRLGLDTASATKIASLYWVMFTLGRLISAPLALRLPPQQLITGGLVLASLSLAAASLPAAAPVAYSLTGLFLAPVFTTALVWLTRELPGRHAPTLVFAGSFLGPVLFAPLIGQANDLYGPIATPISLLGIALLDLAAVLCLIVLVRQRARARLAHGL